MRVDSVNDLPEPMRSKAILELKKQGYSADLKKLGEKSASRKYGNSVTWVGNIKFDSKREAERYILLKSRLENGEIEKLKLQPEFTITEAYKLPDGRVVKAQRYRADFSYFVVATGEFVVEDAKVEATKTRVFINKSKLLYEKYGFVVALV